MAEISEEKQQEYAASVLLSKMRKEGFFPSIILEDHDKDLESLLEWMMTRQLVEISDRPEKGKVYAPSREGHSLLASFDKKYREMLSVYDVFCAVDLQEGCFAFSEYFSMEKADWKEYLKLDRWDDLRLAVAEFKKINPVEFVFLSFVHEGRFDTRRSGWQFDLVLGSTWAEMIKIADTAVKISDLSYECEDERVSGDVVIRDVFRQGIELNIALDIQGIPTIPLIWILTSIRTIRIRSGTDD